MSDYIVLAISLLLIFAVATGFDRILSERLLKRGYGGIPRSLPRIDGRGVYVRNVKAVRVGRFVILTVVLEKPSGSAVSEVEISDPIGLSALALLEEGEKESKVTS